MTPTLADLRINRLRASIDSGRGLGYPQAEHDVISLLGELERVREDNDVLRKRHAALWSVANGPVPARDVTRIILGGAVVAAGVIAILGIAALVVSLGRQVGP